MGFSVFAVLQIADVCQLSDGFNRFIMPPRKKIKQVYFHMGLLEKVVLFTFYVPATVFTNVF